MTVATNKVRTSAYLDEEVRDKAERLAKLESRSLSSLIEILLKKAIDQAEREGRM